MNLREFPLTALIRHYQWRSQDITDARAQYGHTTFVRTSARSAEVFRGSWEAPPENYFNFTASQVGSQAICIRETRVR